MLPWFVDPMKKTCFCERMFFFEVVIVMVEDKKIQYKRYSVSKISSMHYMEWTGAMLPAVFEELDLVCIFSVFFFFSLSFSLGKGSALPKLCGGLQPPSRPGFYRPGLTY